MIKTANPTDKLGTSSMKLSARKRVAGSCSVDPAIKVPGDWTWVISHVTGGFAPYQISLGWSKTDPVRLGFQKVRPLLCTDHEDPTGTTAEYVDIWAMK